MGQDSKSGGRGLYVDSIEVDPEGGESVLFPCQSWSEDDDLKTQKDIYPQVEPPSDSKPSKENFFDFFFFLIFFFFFLLQAQTFFVLYWHFS